MPLWEALVLILSSINLNAQNISGDYFIEDGVFFKLHFWHETGKQGQEFTIIVFVVGIQFADW